MLYLLKGQREKTEGIKKQSKTKITTKISHEKAVIDMQIQLEEDDYLGLEWSEKVRD